MAPTRAAVLQFTRSKSCFIQIPASWRYTSQPEKILTFEVCHGDNIYYFSWSGKFSHKPANMDSYDEVVEIDSLYAQRLGMEQGQPVLIKEMTFVPSCSQVFVEPVSTDDWETLEFNGELVRSQLLNQVRIVFIDQILPVWISAGVPMFLLVTQLSCSSRVAQINPSTELHVKPKFRDSGIGFGSESESSPFASPTTALTPSSIASPTSNTELMPSSVPSTPAAPTTSTPVPRSSSSLLSRICKYLLGSEHGPETLSPVKANDSDAMKTFNYWQNDARWKTTLRVSPVVADVEGCCANNNDVYYHLLMRQSTTAFVSADSLPISFSNRNQSHRSILVRMQRIVSPEEKLDEKQKGSKQFEGDKLTCFVKLVPMESITNSECECMKALRRDLSFPGRVVVSNLLRSMLKLEIGSRVIVEADEFSVKNVPKIVVERFKMQVRDAEESPSAELMKNLVNEVTSSACPLVLNLSTPLSLNINGNQETVLVSPSCHVNKGQEKDDVAYQLLPLTRGRDARCIFTDAIPLPALDVPGIKLREECIGAVEDVLSDGLRFLKLQLELSALAQSLSVSGSSKCMAVVGSRGSGKSAVARALCRKLAVFPFFVHSEVILCKQLKGKRSETIYKLWKKVFAQAVYKAPSVVVFDDLDHLCGSSSLTERNAFDSLQEQIATMLVDLLKYELPCGTPVAVLATCCTKEALHPLLISTRGCHVFTKCLVLQPLNLDQRKEVLKSLLLQRDHVDAECVERCNLADIAKRTDGAVAQDLKLLVDKAVYSGLSNPKSGGELMLETGDFEWALNDFTPSNLRDVAKNLTMLSKGWNDVGGLGDVKKTMEETFFWPTKYPELFAQCPLRLSTGLLLYGPPGTGKTMMAGALAKECSLNFISIKGPELLSKYIGASEQAVRDLFSKAQCAKPCVLFFDEFDAIAPRRGHDSTGVTDRVVNQLLTQMDGVEERTGVYVLAATSRPDLIDPALLRPGRLDKCLQCPLPEKEEQMEIVRILSRSLHVDPDVDWTVAADTWENFSGADLQALLFDAQLLAMRETPAFAEQNAMDTSAGSSSLQWFRIPNLEEGLVKDLSPEKKNSIQKELENIVNQQTSQRVDPSSNAKTKQSCCATISQKHLIQAAQHMKPSVSPTERLRYKKIYCYLALTTFSRST